MKLNILTNDSQRLQDNPLIVNVSNIIKEKKNKTPLSQHKYFNVEASTGSKLNRDQSSSPKRFFPKPSVELMDDDKKVPSSHDLAFTSTP